MTETQLPMFRNPRTMSREATRIRGQLKALSAARDASIKAGKSAELISEFDTRISEKRQELLDAMATPSD